jgi:hypothetical protein
MVNEVLLIKDWQLLTALNGIKTLSYIRTILDNQAVIIASLKNIPLEQEFFQLKTQKEYSGVSEICS